MKKLIFIIMIGSILKFFGCTSNKTKENNQNDKERTEFEEKIAKSLENFQNRTIYKHLSIEIIDSTADDKLLQVVFDNLSEQLPNDYQKEYDYVTTKFNSSQQAIFLSWWLEGEVNNGGFNQYYTNSSGQYADLLPILLAKMDAVKFSDLANRANQIYKTNYKQITQDQDGSLEGFSKSYENNPLNDLDTEFYKLYEIENLYDKQIKFIRNNKQDFVN